MLELKLNHVSKRGHRHSLDNASFHSEEHSRDEVYQGYVYLFLHYGYTCY